jgi:hypothetical protein
MGGKDRDWFRLDAAVERFRRNQMKWEAEQVRFGQELARAQDAGLTVREIGKATGMTPNRVSLIIRGARG